jgi:hypothetical protein
MANAEYSYLVRFVNIASHARAQAINPDPVTRAKLKKLASNPIQSVPLRLEMGAALAILPAFL